MTERKTYNLLTPRDCAFIKNIKDYKALFEKLNKAGTIIKTAKNQVSEEDQQTLVYTKFICVSNYVDKSTSQSPDLYMFIRKKNKPVKDSWVKFNPSIHNTDEYLKKDLYSQKTSYDPDNIIFKNNRETESKQDSVYNARTAIDIASLDRDALIKVLGIVQKMDSDYLAGQKEGIEKILRILDKSKPPAAPTVQPEPGNLKPETNQTNLNITDLGSGENRVKGS